MENITGRRSIRAYTDRPVSGETLQRILEKAARAPSWKNQQCWRLLVVEPGAARERLAAAVHPDNPGRPGLLQAPLALVLLADPRESGDHQGKPYYLMDCGIFLQTLMLAARDEDLGTCVIGWFDEDAVRRALPVPPELRVVALTPLGTPDQDPRDRGRRSPGEFVLGTIRD